MPTYSQKQLDAAIAAAVEKAIAPLRAEIQELKDENSKLQSALVNERRKKDDLNKEITNLKQSNDALACVCASIDNYVEGVKALEAQRSLDMLFALRPQAKDKRWY